MPELNGNFLAIIGLALIYGLSTYWRARRAGVPVAPAVGATARMTASLLALGAIYVFALNALRLEWYSLGGYSLGLLVGLAGLAVFLAFQKWQRRQRHWR